MFSFFLFSAFGLVGILFAALFTIVLFLFSVPKRPEYERNEPETIISANYYAYLMLPVATATSVLLFVASFVFVVKKELFVTQPDSNDK